MAVAETEKFPEIVDQIKSVSFAVRHLVSLKNAKYVHTPTTITPAGIYRSSEKNSRIPPVALRRRKEQKAR